MLNSRRSRQHEYSPLFLSRLENHYILTTDVWHNMFCRTGTQTCAPKYNVLRQVNYDGGDDLALSKTPRRILRFQKNANRKRAESQESSDSAVRCPLFAMLFLGPLNVWWWAANPLQRTNITRLKDPSWIWSTAITFQTYALIQILRWGSELICTAHLAKWCDTLHQHVTAGSFLPRTVEVKISNSGSKPDEEHL